MERSARPADSSYFDEGGVHQGIERFLRDGCDEVSSGKGERRCDQGDEKGCDSSPALERSPKEGHG